MDQANFFFKVSFSISIKATSLSEKDLHDAIINIVVLMESSVNSRANKIPILSYLPNQVYGNSHTSYCCIVTPRSWLIPNTTRKQENFSPQHGTSFCKGGVMPLQLLQEEAITSSETSGGRATERANHPTLSNYWSKRWSFQGISSKSNNFRTSFNLIERPNFVV